MLRRPAGDHTSMADRLRGAVLKPGQSTGDELASPEELEAAARSADDKERLIGLIAAPLAAAIAILVIGALISNDPAALLKNGQVDRLHVSVSLYEGLGAVLLGLSMAVLVSAMLRKRLFLGITLAMYGLAVFNLHYWGFGVPFILAGAWLMVRAYRIQRDYREATAGGPVRDPAPTRTSRPAPNKRYTLPAPARRR